MTVDFEKDEFNFYATALVFGKRGSKINDFKQFNFPIFRNGKNISFREYQGLNVQNRMDLIRTLNINNHYLFITDHTSMSSSTSKIIHFKNVINKTNCHDFIFSEEEFNYYERNWDALVKEKIRRVGILIRSIFFGVIEEVPILIAEFPEISRVLFDDTESWIKENK